MLTLNFNIYPKQLAFINARADEVLYGGAAGGGKTYAQVLDALLYALKYPCSKQLILRRTFPELERNIVRLSLSMYPGKPYARYNATKHVWNFYNGSLIEFGYLNAENDVFMYQGAEYDVIRFDEATHFLKSQADYLRTRCRGANPYPKSVKYSTNPGGVGHLWVKEAFVDPSPPNTIFRSPDRTLRRVFIPALVYDNKILLENDPAYVLRLESMEDEDQRRGLLNGEWDVYQGQFFSEFSRSLHVVEPYELRFREDNVKLYRSIDYGLDGLACYWFAVLPKSKVNPYGSVICYRELCGKDLAIYDAARLIREYTTPEERISCTYAPVDVVRSRNRVDGKHQGDIFAQNGLALTESNNDRKSGWLAVKELLHIREGGRPILKIFNTCTSLIRSLPQLQHDPKHPGDVLTEPHEITHSPDSLRYFANQWTRANPLNIDESDRVEYPPDMLKDYRRSDPATRARIEKQMGGKPKLRKRL